MKQNQLHLPHLKNTRSTVRVGLDFSTLDTLSISNGQYRYVVDLIKGLSEINQDRFKFIVFGSKLAPVSELVNIFEIKSNYWTYQQITPWNFKGSYYFNHLRYAAIIYSQRIDIWHAFHGFIPIAAPCRIILTAYDLMYELFDEYKEAVQSRPYQILKWSTQYRVNHIMPISQTTGNDLQKLWNINSTKISVVHLGSNFSDIHADSAEPEIIRLIQADSGAIILSPFNLEPRKNLHSLVMAMPTIIQKYPNASLVLYGRAAWTLQREQEFRKLVSQLEIDNAIILTGFVEDADLATLYRHATIFVFPSVYEGFGLPVLEAMSMGACVVTRKASAMAEIVGDAGVLVENCNQNDLAEAILMLLNDELIRNNFKEAARQRSKIFLIQNMAFKTWSVYEKMLASSNPL